ncbi:MAG: hypothetical protein IPJ75_14595 [Ignavibacteriales bacterium]|nr:hypothetical protein [Ignavibacteriales bacterium]
MNQELTVSAKLPQFLIREAENVMNRNRELILLLRDNQICIDEEGKYIAELTKSFDEIRSISPYAKQFESILFKVIKHCKKRFSLNIEYSEINLCQKSVDKIYQVPEKPATEIEQLSNSYNEITFCTGNNVLI